MNLEEIKKYLEDNKENEDVKAYLEGLTQVTPEGVEAFLETDEGKKVLQPKLDRNFTKGLETWKEKNLQKLIDEGVKKSNPTETPEQKEIRELKEKFANIEKEKTRESLKNKALTTLSEKKLPSNLVDFLIGEDEETTNSNLTKFEEVFTNQLQSVVDEKLKAGGTNLNSSQTPSTFTREQINSMSHQEVTENWEAIQESLKSNN